MNAQVARLRLDRQLESWARWCEAGRLDTGGRSVLARWMDGRGHIIYGGSPSESKDALETAIEAAVLNMAAEDVMRADVLRLEYSAGVYQVAERRGIRGYDPRLATHQTKSSALGLSVRTYRRRLAEAKQAVSDALSLGGQSHAPGSR